MCDNKYIEYNIITMEYSCCVPGCKSNYKKEEPSVTVFKFPSIGEFRQKYFEDKDVHGFNINTNPDGTTYTVSDVVLIKLFYCTSSFIITKIKSMLNMVLFYL